MKKPEIFSYTSQQLSGKIVINHNSLKNNIFISAASDVFCTYTKLLTSVFSFYNRKEFPPVSCKEVQSSWQFQFNEKKPHK